MRASCYPEQAKGLSLPRPDCWKKDQLLDRTAFPNDLHAA